MGRSYYNDVTLSGIRIGDGMSIGEPLIAEDFFKPATWENPYPAYTAWREQSPLIARMPS